MKKQRGSISLLGILSIVTGLSGFYMVMELGNKMIMDRNFDNYADALAPVVLRTELALTQSMIDAGEVDKARNEAVNFLADLGHAVDSDITLDIKFGNMIKLDGGSATFTDPDTGLTYEYSEQFEPLTKNPSNPKKGLVSGEMPEEFSAVSIEIIESSKFSLLPGFRPTGRAIYGLSSNDVDSPDMANCFCDTRYDQCLEAPEADSVMGQPNSNTRKGYCEYGYAPSTGGMFFGAAKYKTVDSVKFSPQWVGTPYIDANDVVVTDQGSSSWFSVMNDAPLSISSGVSPFTEAYWNAADASWIEGSQIMAYQKKKLFGFGTTTDIVNGDFYIGRSGVCADGGIMSAMMSMFSGNTNCSRYTANISYGYDFADPIANIMTSMIGATGANEHYYSCRDFSGIKKARAGFFQIMMRMFTSPIVDWRSSYRASSCAVKKMKWHGWWMFGSWRDA